MAAGLVLSSSYLETPIWVKFLLRNSRRREVLVTGNSHSKFKHLLFRVCLRRSCYLRPHLTTRTTRDSFSLNLSTDQLNLTSARSLHTKPSLWVSIRPWLFFRKCYSFCSFTLQYQHKQERDNVFLSLNCWMLFVCYLVELCRFHLNRKSTEKNELTHTCRYTIEYQPTWAAVYVGQSAVPLYNTSLSPQFAPLMNVVLEISASRFVMLIFAE